jgi:hypothetical protein
MMPSTSTSLLEQAIQRILELSADLQIKRRGTSKYSLEFHNHGVTIAAYGEALAVLTALQQQEECCAYLGLVGSPDAALEARAVA